VSEEKAGAISGRHAAALLCLCLAVVVLTTFYPVRNFDFINYDDGVYVTENPHVQEGLSPQGIVWAFGATDAGFWQPLTWLSLMADAELYRLDPSGYHWTNLLIHLACTILLFMVLRSMTGAVWRSLIVAALFAVHPLHVEPVAWIAARKDLVSAFFWILALGAYASYAKRPGPARYGIVAAVCSLGLMAKPTLVVLPFLLLLMDFWPLGRLRLGDGTENPPGASGFGAAGLTVRRAVAEKIPLLVLSLLVGIVTVYAEQKAGAVKSLDAFPADVRIANALVSYVLYLGKTVWPAGLAVHYPHPGAWGLWAVAGAAAVLCAVSLGALRRLHSSPWLAVGWFWYLISLLPVIGLVQIGSHSLADRYTYLPSIGLFVAAVWGIAEIVPQRSGFRRAFGAIGVLVLAALAAGSSVQLDTWKDAVTVFRQAVRVAPENALAQNNLGAALIRRGETAAALAHLRKALSLRPRYPEAAFNTGVALAELGRREEAVAFYGRALELKPDYAEALNNIGVVLASQGRFPEAAERFRKALSIRPDYAAARDNYGRALRNLP